MTGDGWAVLITLMGLAAIGIWTSKQIQRQQTNDTLAKHKKEMHDLDSFFATIGEGGRRSRRASQGPQTVQPLPTDCACGHPRNNHHHAENGSPGYFCTGDDGDCECLGFLRHATKERRNTP